jgi:hypothetical protein
MILDIQGPTFQKGQKVTRLGYENPKEIFTISGRFWNFDKHRWEFTLLEDEAKDDEWLIPQDLLEAAE